MVSQWALQRAQLGYDSLGRPMEVCLVRLASFRVVLITRMSMWVASIVYKFRVQRTVARSDAFCATSRADDEGATTSRNGQPAEASRKPQRAQW
jgi:hypothetical protein